MQIRGQAKVLEPGSLLLDKDNIGGKNQRPRARCPRNAPVSEVPTCLRERLNWRTENDPENTAGFLVQGARKEFEIFPEEVRSICLTALTIAAEGGKADIAKSMQGLGSGVYEIALPFKGDAFRVVYAVQFGEDLWGGSCVPEEIDAGRQDAATRNRRNKGSFEKIEGVFAMKKEKLQVVRGSGNVFRDLRHENADAQQFKAILATEIIKALDRTGIAAADFSRIRNANLRRLTVDRLMSIINRLGSRVEVKVRVRRAEAAEQRATA
jgi:hypothetical protein